MVLPNYFYQTLPKSKQMLIYGLTCPKTNQIRYVGKSCSGFRRIRQHFCRSALKSKTKKANWLKSLLAKNSFPNVIILGFATSKKKLSALEITEISKYKSSRLLNMTAGGDGYGYTKKTDYVPWNKDMKMSMQARRSMRAAKLGKKRKARTNKEKQAISQSNITAHAHEAKPFICIETGKKYNSQREAAIELGVTSANISGVLNGHKKRTKGYSFKFL